MVLYELHIFQGSPGAQGQRHAVAILNIGIGREWENAPTTTGAQDDRFRRDDLDSSRH